jgi:hypothetical protein
MFVFSFWSSKPCIRFSCPLFDQICICSLKTLDPDSLVMLDPDPYPGSGFSESGSTALFCIVM